MPFLPPTLEMSYENRVAAQRQTRQNRRFLQRIIQDITSTYVVRVCGESMEGAGISDGDELIVNRALEPVDGSVVVAVLDGELTIKRLRITPAGVVLQAENPVFPDIRVPALSDLVIWGVATRCLHYV
jgi:DNA polymerase V